MPSWCSRRPRRTRRTRPSPSSSCRRSMSPGTAPSWRRAAGARRVSRRSGQHTRRSSRARCWQARRSRPTGRGFWAVAVTCVPPLPCWTAGPCRIPSARCSIRYSRSAIAFGYLPARRSALPSGPPSRRRASSVLDLLDKHHDANAFVRASTLAWTQAQVQLRHLGITAADASLFQRLAGHVLFADASLRPSSDTIRRGGGGPAGLWSQGISGDLPIVLLRIGDVEDIAHLRAAAAGPRVLADEAARRRPRDPERTRRLLCAGPADRPGNPASNEPGRAGRIAADAAHGSVFILRTDLISAETRALLSSVARVVLTGERGSLADQLDRARRPPVSPPARPAYANGTRADSAVTGAAPQDLEFFNGLGGFAADGREYVTLLGPGQSTPAPWINVVANPAFGFQVAAEGSGFTWAVNSRENQLTPWSNDPVTDRTGEAIYVRDEDTGELWGPTAAPIHDRGAFHAACHGQGYSRFTHESHGVALDLLMYVPLDDPIKISRLTIHNTSGRDRRLSITAYVEWVLGASRAACAPFIVTDMNAATGAMFARNPWNAHVRFARRVRGPGRPANGLDGGSAGIPRSPRHARDAGGAGRRRAPCPDRSAPASIPAASCRPPSTSTRATRWKSSSSSARPQIRQKAQALIDRYRSADLDAVFRSVVEHWDEVLGTVQVKTPDRAHGHHAQSLAALSDSGVPDVGPIGVLPGQRGVRLS